MNFQKIQKIHSVFLGDLEGAGTFNCVMNQWDPRKPYTVNPNRAGLLDVA